MSRQGQATASDGAGATPDTTPDTAPDTTPDTVPPATPPAVDTAALCRAILERHHDTIGVRKPAVAVPKLQRILEAALELSNRKGFQAMSLRDLSRASGVSAGGLYAYFDSKTTLLKMILGEVTDSVQRGLSDPPAAIAADPVAHLGWLIDRHLRLTEAMLPWFTFAFMEAKNFPPAERRMAVDSEVLTEGVFAEAIAAGVAAGRLRSDASPLLPALIKPLLQEWYVKRAKYRRRGVTLDAYSATVQDLVLRACLPEGAARPPPVLAVPAGAGPEGGGAAAPQGSAPDGAGSAAGTETAGDRQGGKGCADT